MRTPGRPRTGVTETPPTRIRRRPSAAWGLLVLVLWGAAVTGAHADTSGPDIVSHLNAQRVANGIPAGIVHDASLSAGCSAHNSYMALHPNDFPHTEDPAKSGYTAAGLHAAETSVLHQGAGPWTATRNPFENAPQHLNQLLGPRLDRMGASENAGRGCATTLASRNRPAPTGDRTYSYPGPNATEWPVSQVAIEGPYAGIPKGPYLYVWFDAADMTPFDTAIGTSATLTSPLGGAVPVDITDNSTAGQGFSTGAQMQVIPRAALLAGTTYTATVSASVTTGSGNGPARTLNRTWSFTTAAPPDTTITSGPTGTVNTRSATFTFTASKPGSSFECNLDTGGWTGCSSPRTLTGLPDGLHSLSVRARNAAGPDATPASRSWTVDATPPPVSPPPPPPVSLLPPVVSQPPPPEASLGARFVGAVTLRLMRRGPIRVGSRLKVRAVVRDAQRLRYRWRRDGRSIAGMTRSTYMIRSADRGRRITCRVTAVGTDGVATSRTSSQRRIPRGGSS